MTTPAAAQIVEVIDSHTAGEPTRLVVAGGPDLGAGPLDERRARFAERFDAYRSAIVNEPRGADPLVGALLCAPHRADCDFGVIFFNNVGYLGMCGHGTIGLIASLAHAGRCRPGKLRIDTPVGAVSARLHADGRVEIENVTSYRKARAVQIPLADGGSVTGDVAWGGNWFFLTEAPPPGVALRHLGALSEFAGRVRHAVNAHGFPEVDHVELTAGAAGSRGRNFVLCPGGAYDRSPCGTGTSARLACLAADGTLAQGERWTQESVIGSTFTATYRWHDRSRGEITPTISGSAHVTAEAKLRLDPADPFCWGIRP